MSFSPLSAPFVIHPGFHEYSFIERANDLHLCVGLDEPIRTVRCSTVVPAALPTAVDLGADIRSR